MATFGMQLLSRIISTGCLPEVLEWGITADDFVDPNASALFNVLFGYYKKAEGANSVLGPNSLKDMFPNFVLCDDPHVATAGLCNLVRKDRIVHNTKSSALKMFETLDIEPMQALTEHQSRIQSLIALGDNKNRDILFSSMMDEIIQDYEMAENGVPRTGVRWPWEILNEETGGMQPDDYIIFYGRPKSKKSFVLAYLIAYLYHSGCRGLIYTKEMTPKSLLNRVAAFYAGLPYGPLRKGRLDSKQKDILYQVCSYSKELDRAQNLICLSGKDAQNGKGDTPSWLRSKIELYKPQYVAIDSLYLMNSDGKHKQLNERVQEISREVRQIGLDYGIPIIATLQANRKAAGHKNAELDEIAFSDAIGQDATAAFRVMAERNIDPDQPSTILLGIAGSREWQLDGFRIYAEPCTNFEFHSKVSLSDILSAQQEEAEAQQANKGGKKPSGVGRTHSNSAKITEQLRKQLKQVK